MGEQDQQTRQRLLRCAKAEFLSRGFEHASLRRICGAAGVTTGAVYFFFQNKEDLFAQIVQDTAQQLTQLGHELASEELEHPDTGPDCDLRFMAFLYRHREEALLRSCGEKLEANRELEAYRRAERTERMARERAEQVYSETGTVLTQASNRIEAALRQMTGISQQVTGQLDTLQTAIASSRLALQDAAQTIDKLKPSR